MGTFLSLYKNEIYEIHLKYKIMKKLNGYETTYVSIRYLHPFCNKNLQINLTILML